MIKAGIAVAICSHNGSARLPAVLQALAVQTLSGKAWEILLVDNASTDNTSDAARQAWSRTDVTLRIVSEPRPGVKFARERALIECNRELICFCDDDNLLSADYLEQALELMDQLPQAGVLGGRGEPLSESPLPAWFAAASPGYAVGQQADTEGEVSISRGYVYGAGMILRRAAWEQLDRSGFKPRLLSREGTGLNSGEDNEICLMVSLLGWRIHYSPRLVFRHLIASRRLDEAYCRPLYRGFGEATTVLNAYRDFLVGRASPNAWRRCAFLRLAQSYLSRVSDSVRPRNSGPLTTQSLQREIAAGFAQSCRRTFHGRHVFALYADIAHWLAREGKSLS